MKEHRLVIEIMNSSEKYSHRQELSVIQRFINPPKFMNLAFLMFQPYQCALNVQTLCGNFTQLSQFRACSIPHGFDQDLLNPDCKRRQRGTSCVTQPPSTPSTAEVDNCLLPMVILTPHKSWGSSSISVQSK